MSNRNKHVAWYGMWAAIALAWFVALGVTSCQLYGQTTAPAPTTQPIYPPSPTTQPYAIDRTIYVSSSAGSDTTGTGSITAPYASFNAAETASERLLYSRPTTSNDAILLKYGDTFQCAGAMGIHRDNLVIGAWNQTTWNQKPILLLAAGGFNTGSNSHVHFVDLHVEGNLRNPSSPLWTNRDGGTGFNITSNGWKDITLDGCTAWYCTYGIAASGQNGQPFRVWNYNGSFNYYLTPPPAPVNKAFGLYTQGVDLDARNIVLSYNGWCQQKDQWMEALFQASYVQSHGAYLSAFASPTKSYSAGNFYLCNAATGLQMRMGGISIGDVFVNNGVARDVFTDGWEGTITNDAILDTPEAGPWTGGGILGQSNYQWTVGNVLLRSTPTSSPALELGWNMTNGQPDNDITGAGPTADSIGIVTGNIGVWPGPLAPKVSMPRTYQFTGGNQLISPPPGVHIPTFLDWSGAQSTAAWAQSCETNPSQVNAAACVTWARQQAQAILNPAPTVLGTGQTSGGVPFKVIAK